MFCQLYSHLGSSFIATTVGHTRAGLSMGVKRPPPKEKEIVDLIDRPKSGRSRPRSGAKRNQHAFVRIADMCE